MCVPRPWLRTIGYACCVSPVGRAVVQSRSNAFAFYPQFAAKYKRRRGGNSCSSYSTLDCSGVRDSGSGRDRQGFTVKPHKRRSDGLKGRDRTSVLRSRGSFYSSGHNRCTLSHAVAQVSVRVVILLKKSSKGRRMGIAGTASL